MRKSIAVWGLAVLAVTLAGTREGASLEENGRFQVARRAAAQTSFPAVISTSTGLAATMWDSVYSAEQASRGATLYAGACARCHGANGNGAGEPDMPDSPSVARAGFIGRWNGKTVDELFTLVKTTMPQDNKGSLTDQQFIDVVAHMLALSGAPAGTKDLVADPAVLTTIVIAPRGP